MLAGGLMQDRPDAIALLGLARETLLRDLLASVPKERRFEALMIANALGIAAREIADAGRAEAAQQADLATLLGDPAAPADALRRRLAAEIRAGARDGDPAVHAVLRRAAIGRLKISNPKALPDDAPRAAGAASLLRPAR